jgi:hypothetical protein
MRRIGGLALLTTPAGTQNRIPDGSSAGQMRNRGKRLLRTRGSAFSVKPLRAHGVKPVVAQLEPSLLVTRNGAALDRCN